MQLKMSIPLVIGLVVLLVVILIAAFTVLPWAAMYVGIQLSSNPPKPEITYGEFPFRLTYELNGKTKVIEDAVICEFDGFEQWGEAGKYRKWKSRLKSGNEQVTLLKVDETMELYFSYGNPEFYMNDSQHGRAGDRFDYNPNVIDYVKWENGQERHSAMLANEAWEKYKIKLISWDYTPPIKNSFKE